MIINSFPYLIFVLILVLITICSVFLKQNKFSFLAIRLICGFLFIIFFAFRGFIGWDWYNYYDIFTEVPKISKVSSLSFLNDSLVEPGFLIYTSILKSFFNNYHILTLVGSIIDLFFLNYFFRKFLPEKYYSFGFLLFFIFGGFYFETDLLRNARSFFIFLYSLEYIENRRPVKYYILNCIGVFFHLSSLIYLFVYKILNFKISKKIFVFAFVAGNLIFLLQIQYVKPLITFVSDLIGNGRISFMVKVYFAEEIAKAYGISIGYLERNITALLVIFYLDQIRAYNKTYNIFINAYLIYFVLFFFFSEIDVLSIRFGILFYFSYWILIPVIYDLIKSLKLRIVYMLFVSIFCFLKMHGMTKESNYRYENILIDDTSYMKKSQELEKLMNKVNE